MVPHRQLEPEPGTKPAAPTLPCMWGQVSTGRSPMDADDIVFAQLTAIIARLEMHIEQLTIHVDGLRNHTFKDEIASEKARISAMCKELDRLQKLKELYANRIGSRAYTHH